MGKLPKNLSRIVVQYLSELEIEQIQINAGSGRRTRSLVLDFTGAVFTAPFFCFHLFLFCKR